MEQINNLFSNTKTHSCIIYKNNVEVYRYGDVTHKILVRSCRKSFMSCMFGILDKIKPINLDFSMSELNIDDIGGLTDKEKQATISDLLKSKSGIYHPSAYETENMKKMRPLRGSHDHGTFWYYNNWDFNVLNHIYSLLSDGNDFYKDLECLGKEIGMVDFVSSDGSYGYEECSKYPSYDFKMSCRDMSKLGLLYANQGVINGKEFIDKEWIDITTLGYTTNLGEPWPTNSYGMLWWSDSWGYGAYGYGGHMIAIIPDKNIVIVHRVDNDEDDNVRVSVDDLNKLIQLSFDL